MDPITFAVGICLGLIIWPVLLIVLAFVLHRIKSARLVDQKLVTTQIQRREALERLLASLEQLRNEARQVRERSDEIRKRAETLALPPLQS